MSVCHCATCACSSGMTPAIRFDVSPAEKETVIREKLIGLGWLPPEDASTLKSNADYWLAEYQKERDKVEQALTALGVPYSE